jgi:hypothetical protein
MGGKIVRTIGIVRARFKIGMMNLRLQYPPVGSARADGGCARLNGVGVASCNGRSARRLMRCDLHEAIRTSHIPKTKVVRKCF